MEQQMELQQLIYHVLKMQIEFGVYCSGARLPTMEKARRFFQVSLKTIRCAYYSLQKEGYIIISKKTGVKVKVAYSAQEIDENVRAFFSCRKDALIDLSHCMWPLFGRAQWLGFRNASPELLDELETIAAQENILPPYRMIAQLQRIYGSMKNDLLMRLVWQVFMFYQAPFLSVPSYLRGLYTQDYNPLLYMITLSREQKWTQLQVEIESFQQQLSAVLCRFYDNLDDCPSPNPPVKFDWSCYKKASQRCYSFSMALLSSVSRGVYLSGSLLPSPEKLAKENNISVSTVRRSLSILGSIGVTKSINGVGTRILLKEEISENCDFSHPAVRKRFLDYIQSLHIISLSCKAVSKMAVDGMHGTDVLQYKDRLNQLRRVRSYKLAPYSILEIITRLAPSQTIRTVYTALFQQLLWGYPLRSMFHQSATMEATYLDTLNYFIDCLDRMDSIGFSLKLEEVISTEAKLAVQIIEALGITEVSALLI